MLSFHGKQETKDFYLARVKAHRIADRIIQGTGWKEQDDGVFRGCAVGCSLENYDHSKYPVELGLPEWLARLEDRIFEELPKDEAMEWPEKFLSAIPVGVDVENVRHHLAIKRMNRLILLQKKSLNKYGEELKNVILQVITSIEIVKKCHEAELGKNYCDWSAAEFKSLSAANSAADSDAWSAAESAASAANSAHSADSNSDAWSALSAAWAAADSATFQQEASDLLELLSECK